MINCNHLYPKQSISLQTVFESDAHLAEGRKQQ
jgi:hypothetical protein